MFFTFRLVGWLGGRPVWPVSMLKRIKITFISWIHPFRDSITNFNHIRWKMPKICMFFTFGLVGWLGGRPVWLVSMLKSLQFKYICWVLPFRDYIPSFNQISWKMPKLCTFFTFWLVGWLAGLSDCIGYWYWVYNILVYWVFPIHVTNFVFFSIQYNTVQY